MLVAQWQGHHKGNRKSEGVKCQVTIDMKPDGFRELGKNRQRNEDFYRIFPCFVEEFFPGIDSTQTRPSSSCFEPAEILRGDNV